MAQKYSNYKYILVVLTEALSLPATDQHADFEFDDYQHSDKEENQIQY
jgi:hypothetical protein